MAAADTIVARTGDTLDALLWRERGRGPDDLPATLALNPGVAALGVVLPTGTVVTVPATAPAAARAPTVNLWD